ncbi:type I restriction-modification system subunit M N-terminal domain-containing protein [Prosthecobacter sp. SYSU 5D2]
MRRLYLSLSAGLFDTPCPIRISPPSFGPWRTCCGDYKQPEYGKVILPFTVLRRLDCVLEGTKPAVLAEKEKRKKAGLNPEPFLLRKSGLLFYNTSLLDLKNLMGD